MYLEFRYIGLGIQKIMSYYKLCYISHFTYFFYKSQITLKKIENVPLNTFFNNR